MGQNEFLIAQMRQVIDKLNKATIAYEEGNPYMTDREWDDLYFALIKMEKEAGVALPNSPTQIVQPPNAPVTHLEKIAHNHPMLSLDKTKELKDIVEFAKDKNLIVMAKLDGLTCSLLYEDGKLVRAETRGDGEVGEIVTHNAMQIKNLPKGIPNRNRVVVDGEVICKKSDFVSFSNEYDHPRNFAAGSVRLLDPKESAKRKLSFIAWDFIEGGEDIDTFSKSLITLDEYGFEVVPWEFANLSLHPSQQLNAESFPIDGYVYKYEDIAYGKSLGRTYHHFKNAIAFKLEDEVVPTKLVNIEWSMGRTGVFTPVALLEPIYLDGARVSRASLHNLSIMDDLGVGFLNQEVGVFKANAILPQIAWAKSPECKDYPIEIPSTCPHCKEHLRINNNDGVRTLVCDNKHCSGKLITKLEHFVGKKGLDIKGLSTKTLEKLIEKEFISDYEGLFTLVNKAKEWKSWKGWGEASVNKILDSIESARHCDWTSYLSAIGIPQIGTTASKQLGEEFDNYEEFRSAIDNGFDFTTIKDFGQVTHDNVVSFDYSLADRVAKLHMDFKKQEKKENEVREAVKPLKEGKITGKVFVLSGKMTLYSVKRELEEIIRQNGGIVADKFFKKHPPDFVISNDKSGKTTKVKEAIALSVPIITEEEFNVLFDLN